MSDYFQGILQLREPTDEAVAFVQQAISKGAVELSKVKEVKGGIDFYLSSNKFLLQIGRRLQSEVGGELTMSRTLHTRSRQTSKDLWRVTVMFRPWPVGVGSVVATEEGVFKVTGVGKKVTGQSLVGGKKRILSLDDARILAVHKTTVVATRPTLTVMHPQTYQSVAVENPASVRSGQSIKVALDGERLYIV